MSKKTIEPNDIYYGNPLVASMQGADRRNNLPDMIEEQPDQVEPASLLSDTPLLALSVFPAAHPL